MATVTLHLLPLLHGRLHFLVTRNPCQRPRLELQNQPWHSLPQTQPWERAKANLQTTAQGTCFPGAEPQPQQREQSLLSMLRSCELPEPLVVPGSQQSHSSVLGSIFNLQAHLSVCKSRSCLRTEAEQAGDENTQSGMC